MFGNLYRCRERSVVCTLLRRQAPRPGWRVENPGENLARALRYRRLVGRHRWDEARSSQNTQVVLRLRRAADARRPSGERHRCFQLARIANRSSCLCPVCPLTHSVHEFSCTEWVKGQNSPRKTRSVYEFSCTDSSCNRLTASSSSLRSGVFLSVCDLHLPTVASLPEASN